MNSASAPRVAVLGRTYFWDDFAFRAITRIWNRCDGLDFYVSADETSCGPLDVAPFRKLSHRAADFDRLGLPCGAPEGAAPLWWNSDYALYDAVLKLPDYDYYLLIECDIAVNLKLRPLVDQLARTGVDCAVCFDHRLIGPHWPHRSSCADLPYAQKTWTPLCVMLVSHRAARYLLAERRRIGRMYADRQLAEWPFCEGFVSSALTSAGHRTMSLDHLADLTRFGTESAYLEADPQTRIAGSLCHAVLDAERYWDKFIHRSFRTMLACGDNETLRSMREALVQRGRAEHGGWRISQADGNLALDRPARQSSVSSWSRTPLPPCRDPVAADARGATSGVLTSGYTFHTDLEDSPWWNVDLERDCAIDEIRVFNGLQSPERARYLRLSVSKDGQQWREVFRKTDDRVFAGNDDPLVCRLAPPVAARHVRVMLDGPGLLHLGQVEVYGTAT